MKKKLLIFGVSGFVGSNFLKHARNLSDANFDITSVVARNGKDFSGWVDNLEIVDSFDYVTLSGLLSRIRPDYVVNFIGLFGNKTYEDLIMVNVGIPQKILQAILDLGLLKTRLLFIGSAAEYGIVARNPLTEDSPLLPTSIYGLSKVLQTNLIQFYYRNYRINSVIARTFNLIGDGLSKELSIGNFQEQIDRAKNGDTIKTGNLDSKRDFLDISIAVDLYSKLLFHGEPGHIYNVCRGVPTRIGEILEDMISKSRKNLKIEVSENFLKKNDIHEIYGSRIKLDSLIAKI